MEAGQLCGQLGLTPVHASRLLEIAGGDVQAATALFHKDPSMFSVLQRNVFCVQPTPSPAQSPDQRASIKRPNDGEAPPCAPLPEPKTAKLTHAPVPRKAQRCSKCGQPRKGHTCPFALPAKASAPAPASPAEAAAPTSSSLDGSDSVDGFNLDEYDVGRFLDSTGVTA